MKPRALVIRHAASGDSVQSSVVLPYLKKDGYEVHFLTSKIGMEILNHNPNIDRLIPYTANAVPIAEIGSFYEDLAADYSKTVCLTGSVEEAFLKAYPDEAYYWPHPKRHKACDKNYIEESIRHAGYEPNGVRTGQLFFSQEDLSFANNFRKQYKDNFIICWALSGSSLHKVYRHYSRVVTRILEEIPEAIIVELGTPQEYLLSYKPRHPRVIPFLLEQKPIMTSFALTKVADLVIGPETAVLNAAGCFDTPKICLLTHSSKHNLTETWANDFSLQSLTHCSPCHLLHTHSYIWQYKCPVEKDLFHTYGKAYPECIGAGFPPDYVFNQIMEVYNLKKQGMFNARKTGNTKV